MEKLRDRDRKMRVERRVICEKREGKYCRREEGDRDGKGKDNEGENENGRGGEDRRRRLC